jgi:hypothetical protein
MRSVFALVLGMALCGPAALAQEANDSHRDHDRDHRHSIVSISICKTAAAGVQGSCPSGTVDTFRFVLAPNGDFIDDYANLATLSDEHATVLPPGTLPRHSNDYLFLVATKTTLQDLASGLTFLTGGTGPDAQGQWTFDFASDYGLYDPQAVTPGTQNGQVFLAAMAHDLCPTVANAKFQDQTFDLNYADPGTVFVDPTSWASPGQGNLLMIYEGTSRCVGVAGGTSSSNFYSTIGVATSIDFGHTWPTYRRNWVALPNLNQSKGPEAPLGAFGDDVCFGNDCWNRPPSNYGRYAVLSPPVTVGGAIAGTASTPGGLQMNMGNSEPSAFVDDVSLGQDRYVYTVTGYAPGPAGLGAPYSDPQLPNGAISDLVVARAKLNGGTAPLEFKSWLDGTFDETRIVPPGAPCSWWEFCRTQSNDGLGAAGGGLQTPILPVLSSPDAYKSCQDTTMQSRVMGSISYVEDTQQYLLLFVCISHVDPSTNMVGDGAAWFYSTLDARGDGLSDQSQWSLPQLITGSWQVFPPQITPANPGCAKDYRGWYPTIMSLGTKPGHLSTSGYVFYMEGCTDNGTFGGRKYSSRAFTITTE